MLVSVVVTAVLAVVLALWAAVSALRDRPVLFRQLVLGAFVEAAILVQAVVGVVSTAAGAGATDPWTFWGYVVTTLVLLPVAAFWALADRSRTSSVVLLVAAVTVAALQARVWQVWVG